VATADPKASVARGLAFVAVVAAAVVAGRLLGRSFAPPPSGARPACDAPVDVVEHGRLRLGCASEKALSACTGVESGDRVELGPGGCRRISGGMRASSRLLRGLAVDINRASAAELQLLDGIGPALSTAIVADREANGRYTSVDDLQRVRGVGPATIERLRPEITAASR
jgi:competence ComEA-like helix-hairpin-helix protein